LRERFSLPPHADFATAQSVKHTQVQIARRRPHARPPSPALFFFHQFVRSPGTVGSVVPTSRAAIRALLEPIDWANARLVVEFGPGTGVFTRALLALMHPDARLVAIDTNPVFIDWLGRAIDDPRLILIEGSAADVGALLAARGLGAADYVVSGLPFSTIPGRIAHAIMDATASAIRPGGAFLVYQYSLFVLPMLRARFAQIEVERAWRCVPPARLFRAWRGDDGAFSPAAPGTD
jgi:phospholipid N-methyltransferase